MWPLAALTGFSYKIMMGFSPGQNKVIVIARWSTVRRSSTVLDYISMGHFTVVGLVTWPLSGSEAGGDLVLIQKQEGLYQNKVTSSLASTQRPGHQAHNCKMAYYF